MEKKVAYISGPISGLQNQNYEAFKTAQIELQKQDYVVVNPHEICAELYKEFSKIADPTEKDRKEFWIACMKKCLNYLTTCTHVFVLNNWNLSDGANIEILVAQKLQMKIYNYKDFSEFTLDFHITKGKPISL